MNNPIPNIVKELSSGIGKLRRMLKPPALPAPGRTLAQVQKDYGRCAFELGGLVHDVQKTNERIEALHIRMDELQQEGAQLNAQAAKEEPAKDPA